MTPRCKQRLSQPERAKRACRPPGAYVRFRIFIKSLYRRFQALPLFDLPVPRIGTTGTHWENLYGSVLSCAHCGGLWPVSTAGLRLRKITEVDMTWVYFVAGGVVVGLLLYLVVALLKPELF